MKPKFILFQFVIRNNDLEVLDKEKFIFLKEIFNDFLSERKESAELTIKDNNPTIITKESYEFVSFDKKWVYGFQDKNIYITYNHQYPDDDFSLDNYKSSIMQKLEEITSKIFSKSYSRFGFVSESILSSENELKNFEIDYNNLLQKTITTIRENTRNALQEPIIIINKQTYSPNLKLDSVHLSDSSIPLNDVIVMRNELNTLAEKLNSRFDNDSVQIFLDKVNDHLLECTK